MDREQGYNWAFTNSTFIDITYTIWHLLVLAFNEFLHNLVPLKALKDTFLKDQPAHTIPFWIAAAAAAISHNIYEPAEILI